MIDLYWVKSKSYELVLIVLMINRRVVYVDSWSPQSYFFKELQKTKSPEEYLLKKKIEKEKGDKEREKHCGYKSFPLVSEIEYIGKLKEVKSIQFKKKLTKKAVGVELKVIYKKSKAKRFYSTKGLDNQELS